jgi:hypothetical protein
MDTETSQNEATVASLRQLLRDVSVAQASQYFDGEPVRLISAPEKYQLGQVLKTHIVMVLLTCAELRIAFKVHFNYAQVRSYRRAHGHSDEKMSDKQIVDFMKELCNRMGGQVCRVFDARNMGMGMSVPLATRGIYEIYADYQSKEGASTRFGDFWSLDGSFEDLYCSCYVELMMKTDFSNIKSTDEQVCEGELDFL